MILKRFARTIEIEVSPEQFMFRCGRQEHRVPTRGYIKKVGGIPSYDFQEQPKTTEYMPIDLFSSLPADARVVPFRRRLNPADVLRIIEEE